MRTHLAFRNFKPEVTLATAELFDQKPWAFEIEQEKEAAGQAFADKIVAAYGAPSVTVRLNPEEVYEYGYDPAFEGDEDDEAREASIVLEHWSIIQLLIHLRQHVLTTEVVEAVGNPSEDPIKWATSLFYMVKPAMFRARAREGRMPMVTAQDTYTAASWQKLVDAGFAFDGRLTGNAQQWAECIAAPDALVEEATPGTGSFSDLSDSIPDEDEIDVPTTGWDALTRDEVRALAVRHSVPRGNMNKTQLVRALQDAGVTL